MCYIMSLINPNDLTFLDQISIEAILPRTKTIRNLTKTIRIMALLQVSSSTGSTSVTPYRSIHASVTTSCSLTLCVLLALSYD